MARPPPDARGHPKRLIQVEDRGPKRMSMPALLLLGGLAVGLLAQIAQWLGANDQRLWVGELAEQAFAEGTL